MSTYEVLGTKTQQKSKFWKFAFKNEDSKQGKNDVEDSSGC